jgi:hypothetical protein
LTLTVYSDASGAWVNGTTPVSAANMNAIRNFLIAAGAMWDSNASWNGSGVLTSLGQVVNGPTTINGTLGLKDPGTAQTLSNGSTITVSSPWIKVTCAAAVTGIIMPVGSFAGQVVYLCNESTAGSLTFATGATSHVTQGTNVACNVGRLLVMIWDGSGWIASASA